VEVFIGELVGGLFPKRTGFLLGMPNPNAYLEHHLWMCGHRWIQGGSLEKTELVVE